MLFSSYVPPSFCVNFTVPHPKGRVTGLAKVDDYRGIAVSSVLAKLFESCILALYGDLLASCDAQFGFKTNLGCTHAVHVVKSVIDGYTAGGNTAHLCAIDVAKAFPSVNHYSLLSKLIKRNVPVTLLDLLEFWLRNTRCQVRWNGKFSADYGLRIGLNQGSVLAPALFAVLIDDVLKTVNRRAFGVVVGYADDIIIISRSLYLLQLLFSDIESGLLRLGLRLNVTKCMCLKIGPNFESHPSNIISVSGSPIGWVDEIRYLGVFLREGNRFRASFDAAKT